MCFHKKQITCITARNLITNQDYIDVGFSNVKPSSRGFYQSGTFTGILSRDKEFVRSDSDLWSVKTLVLPTADPPGWWGGKRHCKARLARHVSYIQPRSAVCTRTGSSQLRPSSTFPPPGRNRAFWPATRPVLQRSNEEYPRRLHLRSSWSTISLEQSKTSYLWDISSLCAFVDYW